LIDALLRERKKGSFRGDDSRIFSKALDLVQHQSPKIAEMADSDRTDIARIAIAELYQGAGTPIDQLRSLFLDPEYVAGVQKRLDTRWRDREAGFCPPEVRKKFDHLLVQFMSHCRTRGVKPFRYLEDPAVAESLWRQATDLDAASAWLGHIASMGLSATQNLAKPSVTKSPGKLPAPLHSSIYDRVWSVFKGARAPWDVELPGPKEIVEKEIVASASAFGLRTREARTALILGLLMCIGSDYENPAKPVREFTEKPLDSGVDKGAVEYVRRRFSKFVHGLNSRDMRIAATVDRIQHPEFDLMPRLWTRLHSFEYRADKLLDGAGAWDTVSGIVTTYILDTKQWFLRGRLHGPILKTETMDVGLLETDDLALQQGIERNGDTADLVAGIMPVLAFLRETNRAEEGRLFLEDVSFSREQVERCPLRERWRGYVLELVAANAASQSEARPNRDETRLLREEDLGSFDELLEFIRLFVVRGNAVRSEVRFRDRSVTG
jgi:hypothetical protein